MFQIAWVTPEQAEDLIEGFVLFALAHETGMKSPVKILPIRKPCGLDCSDGVQHPPGADRQTCTPKRPPKMRDIMAELSVFGNFQFGKRDQGYSLVFPHQVRVLERRGIFQPVPQHAIDTDVQRP